MKPIGDRPLFTRQFEEPSSFVPVENAVYLYGVTSEPRSEFALALVSKGSNVRFVEIRDGGSNAFETNVDFFERISARNRRQVVDFIKSFGSREIYIDITGLDHSTWAPLIRVCLELGRVVRAIYLEPETYSVSPSPDAGEIFDLSERIEGIAPIPLFVSLDDRPEEQVCFIPLLGFEGVRFAHMLNEIQPLAKKIHPIIGVPGFQPHYPLDAYLGNASALEKYKSYRNIRFAKSNCPFSVYYALYDLRQRNPGHQLKIGLIGTKPHALGAILFAIAYPDDVEIVYDNVKRKVGRTKGYAQCLVYSLSDFEPIEPSSL